MKLKPGFSTKKFGRARRWPKAVSIGLAVAGILLAAAVYALHRTYQQNLLPVSQDQTAIFITIEPDSSVNDIADALKSKKLIRSDWAFEWYVRSKELNNSLQYGTYGLTQSMSTAEIVEVLRTNQVASDVVTIYPARRLDQIRADLIKNGFSETSLDEAFKPANYSGHPALSDKPADSNLEGYLFPESFEKTADTTAEDIIRKSLDEMAKELTPQLRAAYAKRGLSVHEAITMASIIEEEISYQDKQRETDDREQVAQVFLTRLHLGMRLESDPTATYGAVLADATPTNRFDSAYNTYLRDGLPPGPISNVSKTSLLAVANPANTDWIYFVSGCDQPDEDLKTYFSRTLKEHEALTAKYARHDCKQ